MASAIPPDPASSRYVLRLYVSGRAARSARAIVNIRHICETHLKNQYELEVIDIYQDPQGLRENQVVAVPTLIRLLPEPLRRMIGDLSDSDRVLAGLEIIPNPESPD
ncbi:Circadian clock protein KaiB [Rhodovastum atsumiense]|uniref:Circadian clock protein KaiB n=1 Tax=Rhodovastum atsumiense TaxID=504468 RepID=A0A5M6IRE7_9PROT|nr:circadian clock KaiB family protein [Rhodovastum atsumiense]KAA5610863.1 circadian clock protein KaiB [Rhodovastum atsumiense]CAH2602081.1 Circadian clock protein KaiB [Rhodovastum atsumiense]